MDNSGNLQLAKEKEEVRDRLEFIFKVVNRAVTLLSSPTTPEATGPLRASLEHLLDRRLNPGFDEFYQGLSAALWEQMSDLRVFLNANNSLNFQSLSYSLLVDLARTAYEKNMKALGKLWRSIQPARVKAPPQICDSAIFVPVWSQDGHYYWDIKDPRSPEPAFPEDYDFYPPPFHDDDIETTPKYDLCSVVVGALGRIAGSDVNILQERCVKIIENMLSRQETLHEKAKHAFDKLVVQELIRATGFYFRDGFPKNKTEVVERLTNDNIDGMLIRVLFTDAAVKGPNTLEWSSYYSIAKSQSTTGADYEFKIVYGGSCTGLSFSTAQKAVDMIMDASFVDVTKSTLRARFGIQGWGIARESAKVSKRSRY